MTKAIPTTGTKLRKIVNSILKSIATGQLRNGDRVTSERQLAKQFQVSLGTVQRALQHLEYRGIIIRQQGRGNFVKGLGASLDARYVRFRNLDGKELPVFWHLLQHKKTKSTNQLRQYFKSSESLVRIDRQVDVDGQFSLFSHFFLLESSFNALSDDVKDGTNLRELISRRLALPVIRVEKLIGFGPIPAIISRAIGHVSTELGLIIELHGYAANDQPVYIQRLYSKPFVNTMMVIDSQS